MTKSEIQQLFIAFQNSRRKRLKKRLNVELEEAIINELKKTNDKFVRLLLENNDLTSAATSLYLSPAHMKTKNV